MSYFLQKSQYIDQQDSSSLREGFNISKEFLPWVEQLGYPVVKVEQISNGSLIATQVRAKPILNTFRKVKFLKLR